MCSWLRMADHCCAKNREHKKSIKRRNALKSHALHNAFQAEYEGSIPFTRSIRFRHGFGGIEGERVADRSK
jgi:hypothetical protein